MNIPNLIGAPDRRGNAKRSLRIDHSSWRFDHSFLSEESFLRILGVERKRAERSRKVFLLMLVDWKDAEERDGMMLARIAPVISSSIRETDFSGWYKEELVIGVILTEIGDTSKESLQIIMSARVRASLGAHLDEEEVASLRITFHAFPEDWNKQNNGHAANAALYPDLRQSDRSKRLPHLLKRTMDIVGSMIGLICLSPLLLLVALAIKLTSKGPIFFTQGRVGQFGTIFTFVKFRSMRIENDPVAHREFVARFIAGTAEPTESERELQGVYKITADPRVTIIGKFLRKTSIDELPQLWNVLRGQMSLVGPRPPIPYELNSYDLWHRRRLLEVKPGITGLWQVHGRSRTTFDEMVRLDLRYAREWSLWLDIKILLKTPKAVVSCNGAY